MNKILTIILILISFSCYVDDLNVDQQTFVIPENTCDCVYWYEDTQEWRIIKLRPGQTSIGWLSYSRLEYCEEVMIGYLTNCK